MFILPRYIIRQHIGPFVFGCSVISLLFLLNLVFRVLGRFLSKGLGIAVVLEFFILNLAWILALAIPMAVLTATLMAFGRLSADNEITAIKASGVSLYRIIMPVLIVSTGLAFFLIWFNNNILPNFNHRVRVLTSNITSKRPTIEIEPGVMLPMENFNIIVQKILDEKEHFSLVENVLIYDKSNSRKNKTITAQKAEIAVDVENDNVSLTLYDGEIHEIEWDKLENYQVLQFSKHSLNIQVPNMKLNRMDSDYYGDREKSAQTMLKEIRANREHIKNQQDRINAIVIPKIKNFVNIDLPDSSEKKAIAPYTYAQSQDLHGHRRIKKPPALNHVTKLLLEYKTTLQKARSQKNIINNYNRTNYVLLVEVHKKYSIPVACIVFILIGAPLGIMSRRGNMAVSGGIGLFFFILYWAFLIAGEELADRQLISPATAMWSPNFVVGIFGIYMVISSVRETKFIKINIDPIIAFFKRTFKIAEKYENSR